VQPATRAQNISVLTHEFLSLMLGVRWTGVTEALQSLKRQKLIENGRNKIIIRNRKGIERMAGGGLRHARKGISAAYWISLAWFGECKFSAFVLSPDWVPKSASK
jgi:hypothetical protein